MPIVSGIYCNNGGSGGKTFYCAIVWAMTEWGGVPKQRVGAQRIVLIRAERPRNKTISCIGQTNTHTQTPEPTNGDGATTWPSQDIRLLAAVVHESTILSPPPPTCIAHPGAVLSHDFWAVSDSRSDLPCVCYHTPHNNGNNNIV